MDATAPLTRRGRRSGVTETHPYNEEKVDVCGLNSFYNGKPSVCFSRRTDGRCWSYD